MNFATSCLQGLAGMQKRAGRSAALTVAALLVACGGGAGSAVTELQPAAGCDPDNPATFDECGTVYVGLTDADGDFLNYTTDVVQLALETADGRVVNLLPQSTRINFSEYVDLTELLTAATVPPAVYVAGTITLDYGDAEVFVEAGGQAREAVVSDADGKALEQTTLKILLPEQDRLVVSRGRPSLLQLDFDLAASHVVDIEPVPAEAMAEQFILAEVAPVDEKTIRVRGPLVAVDVDAGNYVVAIRPFHDRAGDFGRFTVNTSDETEFEIDGEAFLGSEGLVALDALGPGTPTVAGGTLDVADREFTAAIVLAGSSVPGIDKDAVVGNVIARSGNFLTVRGATIIPSDRRAHFHDDVIVEIGPNTKVFKDGDRRVDVSVTDLGIDAISIGQRVTIRGEQAGTPTADAAAAQIPFDATEGAVRMHVTHLSGVVNTVIPGQTDITLHSIDRRRAAIFDFSGTGVTSDDDADPGNYEIETGGLVLADFAEGRPIAAYGFPTAFGSAPPDFTGRTVIDFHLVRSDLGIGWGAGGTAAPFLSMDATGLLLDNRNPDIDGRHFIKHGPVLVDLTELDSDTLIVPRSSGRALYYIKARGDLRQYSSFDRFVADLTSSLDGATTARSMHVRGQYDAGNNVFTAYKLGVSLLEP